MTDEEILFFAGKPEALSLYEVFRRRVLEEADIVRIRVQKTQISFANRHNFAFVSFLPARRKAERPDHWITVSFGLRRRLDSRRIDAAVEPYPERWTHHMLVSSPDQIDDELMRWVREAAVFANGK